MGSRDFTSGSLEGNSKRSHSHFHPCFPGPWILAMGGTALFTVSVEKHSYTAFHLVFPTVTVLTYAPGDQCANLISYWIYLPSCIWNWGSNRRAVRGPPRPLCDGPEHNCTDHLPCLSPVHTLIGASPWCFSPPEITSSQLMSSDFWEVIFLFPNTRFTLVSFSHAGKIYCIKF